jgi:hypothetical protein
VLISLLKMVELGAGLVAVCALACRHVLARDGKIMMNGTNSEKCLDGGLQADLRQLEKVALAAA